MIQVKEHRYYGYKQGYKVIIDGIKFPLKRGYFYTTMKADEAKELAISECGMLAFRNWAIDRS